VESETQAELARRRRGGLLIEPAGRILVFGAPARSTGGGGPTDTDSAVNLGCDDPCSSSQSVIISVPLRWISVSLRWFAMDAMSSASICVICR